jgi:hypothetical protein
MGSQKLQIYIHFSQAVREQKAHQTTTIAKYRSGETGSVKNPKAICVLDFLWIFTPNSSVWVWA